MNNISINGDITLDVSILTDDITFMVNIEKAKITIAGDENIILKSKIDIIFNVPKCDIIIYVNDKKFSFNSNFKLNFEQKIDCICSITLSNSDDKLVTFKKQGVTKKIANNIIPKYISIYLQISTSKMIFRKIKTLLADTIDLILGGSANGGVGIIGDVINDSNLTITAGNGGNTGLSSGSSYIPTDNANELINEGYSFYGGTAFGGDGIKGNVINNGGISDTLSYVGPGTAVSFTANAVGVDPGSNIYYNRKNTSNGGTGIIGDVDNGGLIYTVGKIAGVNGYNDSSEAGYGISGNITNKENGTIIAVGGDYSTATGYFNDDSSVVVTCLGKGPINGDFINNGYMKTFDGVTGDDLILNTLNPSTMSYFSGIDISHSPSIESSSISGNGTIYTEDNGDAPYYQTVEQYNNYTNVTSYVIDRASIIEKYSTSYAVSDNGIIGNSLNTKSISQTLEGDGSVVYATTNDIINGKHDVPGNESIISVFNSSETIIYQQITDNTTRYYAKNAIPAVFFN